MVYPSDLADFVGCLDLDREDALPSIDWLRASHVEPEGFWNSLLRLSRPATAPVRSRARSYCELYYELIERHGNEGRAALIWWEKDAAASLTYDELARRALRCASAWAAQGLKPQDRVAIALPVGAEFAVALAALLHLGATVAVADATSPEVIARQATTIGAAYVVTEPPLAARLHPKSMRALAVSYDARPRASRPYAYRSNEPCWCALSPLQLSEVVEISAEAAFRALMHDAVLSYRLTSRSRFSLPGWSHRQIQPVTLATCLLAGCAYVHLTLEQLRTRPQLIGELHVSCLGISRRVRDAIGDSAAALESVSHVVRSVDEPLDWEAERAFLKTHGWLKTPCSSVLVDAAAGGCMLFSARRPGGFSARVLPAAGRRFSLADSAGDLASSAGAFGVFALEREPVCGRVQENVRASTNGDGSGSGFVLLAQRGAEWFYLGNTTPRRQSHLLPFNDIAACAQALPGVVGACVLSLHQPSPVGHWIFRLLVFTLDAEEEEALVRQVQSELARVLGTEVLPDVVDVFGTRPRRRDGRVDVEWYLRQYQMGGKHRLNAFPCRQSLNLLRRTFEANGRRPASEPKLEACQC